MDAHQVSHLEYLDSPLTYPLPDSYLHDRPLPENPPGEHCSIPTCRSHNIYYHTTFGTLSKDLKTSLPHPLFVCGLVINSFPLSDRSHRGENTKFNEIRTRRGAIQARAHKTGLSGRLFAEEGTITIANEEALCAE